MFPLPPPTKLLLGLLAVAGIAFAGYRYGRHIGTLELTAYKSQVTATASKQTIANMEEQRAKERALGQFVSTLEARHINAQNKIDSLYDANRQLLSLHYSWVGNSASNSGLSADSTATNSGEAVSTCARESELLKEFAVNAAKIADDNAEAFFVCRNWALGVASIVNSSK